MASIKITKSVVDSIEPAEKDVVIHDAELKGFHVKVTPAGKKVFSVYYRYEGKQRRYKIGDYGAVTAQQARGTAQQILGRVSAGEDPSRERQQARQKVKSDIISNLVTDFLEKHASQNRTHAETRRIFDHDVLPHIGKKSIHEISKREVVALLEVVVDRGSKTMANRTLAAVRKFFNWCVGRAIIEVSPCQGIPAFTKETSRDRVLSEQELQRIIHATTVIGYPYGCLVMLLCLTGQRLDEVASMSWSEIDLAARKWTIPSSRTKNKKGHTVHLSPPTLAVLQSIPRREGCDLVFTTNGKSPFKGFSKAKARLDKFSDVSDWRLHDIRRTVVTGMAGLGVPPHIADKILNHQSGAISGVAAVYQRSEFLKERREALDLWGEHFEALAIALC